MTNEDRLVNHDVDVSTMTLDVALATEASLMQLRGRLVSHRGISACDRRLEEVRARVKELWPSSGSEI